MADYVSNYSGDQIDEAVGRALPGGALDTSKAPAGFGYGDQMEYVEVSDEAALEAKLDEMLNDMSVRTSKQFILVVTSINNLNSLANLTFTSTYAGGYAQLTVYNWNNTQGERQASNCTFLKQKRFGKWGKLEYVNPIMRLGVEYRTTERHLGKTVYVRAVDCGALPNATSKTLAFGENGVAETISYVGVTSYGVVLTGDSENEHGCSLKVRLNVITLKTQTDQTRFTAIVTVKYIKNTD